MSGGIDRPGFSILILTEQRRKQRGSEQQLALASQAVGQTNLDVTNFAATEQRPNLTPRTARRLSGSASLCAHDHAPRLPRQRRTAMASRFISGQFHQARHTGKVAMRYALILLLPTTNAWAHDWTSPKWSHITEQQRTCIATLYSRSGYRCCNGDDADNVSPKWNYGAHNYFVDLTNPNTGETKAYEVPTYAEVVDDHCGVSSAMVWWSANYEPDGTMRPNIFCFKPGPDG